MSLLKSMDVFVSNDGRRHLRSISMTSNSSAHYNDDVISNAWISDIVLTHVESSSTSIIDDVPETSRLKWVLFGDSSHLINARRYFPHRNKNPFLFENDDDVSSRMSSRTRLDKNINMMHRTERELLNIIDQHQTLENKLDGVKNELSILIKEEVRKQNKPLEEKLERITQLLEQVLKIV